MLWLLLAALAAVGGYRWFHRDPERAVPPRGVVCPADGRVVEVREDREPFVGDPCWKVAVFMSPLDVHVNRSPIEGRIAFISHRPGRFLPAFLRSAARDNEQATVGIEGPEGTRAMLRLIAGVLARRIVLWKRPGQWVQRGERLGMIRLGSRVELFLPREARLAVSPGQRVWAGRTVLAYLREEEQW